MFSTLSLDGSNRIIASELVLINSTEPSTLSSVYATKQELVRHSRIIRRRLYN